jgi:SAM-dependent methyltransferase
MDRRFDLAYGSDTRRVVENRDIRDAPETVRMHGIRYEPTRMGPFRRVLRAVPVPVSGTFVDLGCGKGRALMLAALAGFDHVVGIDYSSSLCAIARANLDRLKPSRMFRADVIAGDIRAYRFSPDDTVIYLYNPFDDTVLRPVLEDLRRSLIETPRPVTLIYQNPVWRAVVEAVPEFRHAGDYSFAGCVFAVYHAGKF